MEKLELEQLDSRPESTGGTSEGGDLPDGSSGSSLRAAGFEAEVDQFKSQMEAYHSHMSTVLTQLRAHLSLTLAQALAQVKTSQDAPPCVTSTLPAFPALDLPIPNEPNQNDNKKKTLSIPRSSKTTPRSSKISDASESSEEEDSAKRGGSKRAPRSQPPKSTKPQGGATLGGGKNSAREGTPTRETEKHAREVSSSLLQEGGVGIVRTLQPPPVSRIGESGGVNTVLAKPPEELLRPAQAALELFEKLFPNAEEAPGLPKVTLTEPLEVSRRPSFGTSIRAPLSSREGFANQQIGVPKVGLCQELETSVEASIGLDMDRGVDEKEVFPTQIEVLPSEGPSGRLLPGGTTAKTTQPSSLVLGRGPKTPRIAPPIASPLRPTRSAPSPCGRSKEKLGIEAMDLKPRKAWTPELMPKKLAKFQSSDLDVSKSSESVGNAVHHNNVLKPALGGSLRAKLAPLTHTQVAPRRGVAATGPVIVQPSRPLIARKKFSAQLLRQQIAQEPRGDL